MANKSATAVLRRLGTDVTALVALANGPFWGTLATDPEATLVNTTAADPNLVLGGTYKYGAKLYRYVQFKDAVTYVSGQSLFVANAAWTQVTNDVTGGSNLTAGVVSVGGVCIGVQTQDKYGFVLVRGTHAALITNGDDDITGSLQLFATAADGGLVDSGAGTPLTYVGWSTAADVDAANTVAAFVDIV